MSFYVTLPSNGAELKSKSDKKNNTQTDFFINLNRPLDLKNYEVALVEVSFKANWLVELGSFEISADMEDTGFKLVIHRSEGVNLFDALKVIGLDLSSNFKRKFNNLEPVMTAMGSIFKMDTLPNENLVEIRVPTGFNFVLSGHVVHYFKKIIGMAFDNKSNTQGDIEFNKNNIIFNDNHISIIGNDDFVIHITPTDFTFKIINEIFLYSNIIDYQFIGSEMAQLLRVISVNRLPLNKLVDIIYDSPHYVPVLDNKIQSIRMFLRDSQGDPIRFTDTNSKVIYKLHFRKIKN